MKKKINEDVLVFSQFVLFFALGIIFIMSLFIKELQMLAYIVMGLLLIIMGINNFKMKKNKILTILCIIIGILVIVMEFV